VMVWPVLLSARGEVLAVVSGEALLRRVSGEALGKFLRWMVTVVVSDFSAAVPNPRCC